MSGATNTKALALKYDRLTPRERFLLQLAASDRGDVLELERLDRTEEKKVYYIKEGEAVDLTRSALLMVHLFMAMWFEATRYNEIENRAKRRKGQSWDDFFAGLDRLHERGMGTMRPLIEAWDRFCLEHDLPRDRLLKVLGGWMLAMEVDSWRLRFDDARQHIEKWAQENPRMARTWAEIRTKDAPTVGALLSTLRSIWPYEPIRRGWPPAATATAMPSDGIAPGAAAAGESSTKEELPTAASDQSKG